MLLLASISGLLGIEYTFYFLSYTFYFTAKNMNFGVRQPWIETLFTNFAMLSTLLSFERSWFFNFTAAKVKNNMYEKAGR